MTGGGSGGPRRLVDGKRRKPSSRRWLERQIRDPYVAAARRRGFRSRAAFKLIELDDRFRLLRPGSRVVDLGAAPGGWTQVAVERAGAGRVVAVDLSEIEPLEGAAILRADAGAAGTAAAIRALLGGPADLVLSDMAPPAIGHRGADHLRIVALAEIALALAVEILAPGGGFVCKVWQGGTEAPLLATIKRLFADVRHAKPPASRAESAELYLVACGFRGGGGRG
jgi:23S rRNA (uridine2552-2'-O)-methyltransferase